VSWQQAVSRQRVALSAGGEVSASLAFTSDIMVVDVLGAELNDMRIPVGLSVLISFKMSSALAYFALALSQSLSWTAESPSWMRKVGFEEPVARNRAPPRLGARCHKQSATNIHNRRVFFIGGDSTEKALGFAMCDMADSLHSAPAPLQNWVLWAI